MSDVHVKPGPVSTPPPAIRLCDIIAEIPGATLAPGFAYAARSVVTGVHHDSRQVAPGDVFVARDGEKVSGVQFIPQAVERGALAVIVKAGTKVDAQGAAVIYVDDVALALALASAAVYGHPTFGLEVIGITGTNGKTTTLHLLRNLLEEAGFRPGTVGTLGISFDSQSRPSAFTSPEADELARIARAMRDRSASHLIMEVSSIALVAKRCDAIRFRVAVFTNLTQDHLDYHGSMENYAAAKARLFEEFAPGAAVLNIDDAFGRELTGRVAQGTSVRTYSTKDAKADVFASSLGMSSQGLRMVVESRGESLVIETPLLGAHNAENLLAAASVALELGIPTRTIESALSRPIVVAGRLERCDDPKLDDVSVVVDYAHTPDALQRALSSLRPFATAGLICVFGCGGDRDKAKRPLMGRVVAELADHGILTNDNPRSERPEDIAEAVLPGLSVGPAKYRVLLDRRSAIREAVLSAPPGAVVLLAGKGHEPYQIIGSETLPFDDRIEARAALAERRQERQGQRP